MIDLRPWLPRQPEYDPTPSRAPKTGYTVHYEGGDVSREMSDAEAQLLILSNAIFHINKDWNEEVEGAQHGGGIMYAIVIAPSGTVYQTRDLDEILWHSGSFLGNQDTTPVMVLAGPNTPPTKAQYRSLREVLMHQIAYPHSYWSATQCPGDAIRYWMEYGDEEDDMEYVSRQEFEEYKQALEKQLKEQYVTKEGHAKHDHKTYPPTPQI